MITHTLHNIPDIDDIIVTNHCKEQFIKRFRLFIPTNFNNIRDLPVFIKKCIKSGNVLRMYEFSPFYVNKNTSKHDNAFFIKTDICVFIAKWDKYNSNKLIIKTAVKRP